jgi:hypothetical protein
VRGMQAFTLSQRNRKGYASGRYRGRNPRPLERAADRGDEALMTDGHFCRGVKSRDSQRGAGSEQVKKRIQLPPDNNQCSRRSA